MGLDMYLNKKIQIDCVGQWRKANQIHNWFVNNVQDGVDDCKEYYVSYSQLLDLKKLCEKAIKDKDASILPPKQGFFFGSTEIDEYYWGNLVETIEMINSLNPDNGDSFYYRASW